MSDSLIISFGGLKLWKTKYIGIKCYFSCVLKSRARPRGSILRTLPEHDVIFPNYVMAYIKQHEFTKARIRKVITKERHEIWRVGAIERKIKYCSAKAVVDLVPGRQQYMTARSRNPEYHPTSHKRNLVHF